MTQRTVEHAIFTIERSFAASPAQVFAAFATEEGQRPWFIEGEGWTVDHFDLDFRAAGKAHAAFRFRDGPPIENYMVYLDIVENRRIVFAYSMIIDGKRISSSLATVELSPQGKGTRLVYTEQGAFLDGADQPAGREAGWRELLDKLGEALGAQRAAA